MKALSIEKRAESNNDEVNVQLHDKEVRRLLRPEKASGRNHVAQQVQRIPIASAGPLSFEVSVRDLLRKRLKITVRLLGIEVDRVVLDEDHCQKTIGPNTGLAKATITLSVNWQRQKVTYEAKACLRSLGGWTCRRDEGTLTKW